jgi:hypothetical protein
MIASLTLCLFLQGVSCQEAPNPALQTEQFNTFQIFRQNFCSLWTGVENGTVPLSDALNGAEIRPLFRPSDEYFRLTDDGTIDEIYPGLVPVLLDEFCRRAGCTWRDSFAGKI